MTQADKARKQYTQIRIDHWFRDFEATGVCDGRAPDLAAQSTARHEPVHCYAQKLSALQSTWSKRLHSSHLQVAPFATGTIAVPTEVTAHAIPVQPQSVHSGMNSGPGPALTSVKESRKRSAAIQDLELLKVRQWFAVFKKPQDAPVALLPLRLCLEDCIIMVLPNVRLSKDCPLASWNAVGKQHGHHSAC